MCCSQDSHVRPFVDHITKENVMIRFTSAACGVVLVGLMTVPPTVSLAYTGQELEKGAKISIADARAIALKTRAGTITDEELEREKGGLRYSFDIKSGSAVYEVGVDAQTGKVLENNKEGAHPD
jgi:hypothetical protein